MGDSNEACFTCGKKVFAIERIAADDKVFHKTGCFKCAHCNCTLSLGKYAALDGKFFCKPHFKQLFALKGNYNEGFGTEKHTKNWQAQPPPPTGFKGMDSLLKPSGTSPQTTPAGSPMRGRPTGTSPGPASPAHTSPAHTSPPTPTPAAAPASTTVAAFTTIRGRNAQSPLTASSDSDGSKGPMLGPSSPRKEEAVLPAAGSLAAAKAKLEVPAGRARSGSVNETSSPVKPERTISPQVREGSPMPAHKETCHVCGKTVYEMERVAADSYFFHKTCLKCTHCNCPLTLGKYAALEGQFYCKPHFKQLFALKGNYSEGFGKDKPAKTWEKNKESSSAETKVATTAAPPPKTPEPKKEDPSLDDLLAATNASIKTKLQAPSPQPVRKVAEEQGKPPASPATAGPSLDDVAAAAAVSQARKLFDAQPDPKALEPAPAKKAAYRFRSAYVGPTDGAKAEAISPAPLSPGKPDLEQAKKEKEEQARKEKEEQARKEKEEQAKKEKEEQAKKEKEEQATKEKEAQEKKEKEEQEKKEKEAKQREEQRQQELLREREAKEKAEKEAKEKEERKRGERKRGSAKAERELGHPRRKGDGGTYQPRPSSPPRWRSAPRAAAC